MYKERKEYAVLFSVIYVKLIAVVREFSRKDPTNIQPQTATISGLNRCPSSLQINRQPYISADESRRTSLIKLCKDFTTQKLIGRLLRSVINIQC